MHSYLFLVVSLTVRLSATFICNISWPTSSSSMPSSFHSSNATIHQLFSHLIIQLMVPANTFPALYIIIIYPPARLASRWSLFLTKPSINIPSMFILPDMALYIQPWFCFFSTVPAPILSFSSSSTVSLHYYLPQVFDFPLNFPNKNLL